jgi:peptide/nickel transport system ATP-binding protein
LRVPPVGCRFSARCPFVVARCRAEDPPLAEAAPDHTVSCWRAAEADTLRPRAMEAATWQHSSM